MVVKGKLDGKLKLQNAVVKFYAVSPQVLESHLFDWLYTDKEYFLNLTIIQILIDFVNVV